MIFTIICINISSVVLFIVLENMLCLFAVFFAFLFFSGDLYKYIPASSISSYVGNYTPELNFYLVPVIVSCAM